jgi:hypothetical protein
MKHRIPHDLPHATARVATRHALEAYQRQLAEFSPDGEWLDEDRARVRFTAAGRTFDGLVEVTPSAVSLELEVPLIFRPFTGIALGVVEREIRGWIERARRGEFT